MSYSRRLLQLPAAGLLAALVAALTAIGAFAAPRPAPIGMASVFAGPKDGGGEPSLAIASDGTEYISYPGNKVDMVVSHDGGKTWTPATSPAAPSGDTSVNVDSSGAVYETNLNGLDPSPNMLQVDLFKSFDQGKTWPVHGQSTLESSNSTGQPFFVDRQWVDAAIPPGKTTNQAVVGMEYHDFGPGAVWVSVSTDGGAHFGLPVDVMTSPLAAQAGLCDTIPGGLKIVPYGRQFRHPGRIYAAWLAADAASNLATGCNETQLAAFHSVWIAFSDDGGKTWADSQVFDAGPLHDGSEIFADLTLDDLGNPYVAYAMNVGKEFDIWATASLDGAQWLKPRKANLDTGTHYYPAIAAGRPGQVVIAYLETPDIIPTTPYGKPSPGADANSDWKVHVAQTLNLFSPSPAFTNAVVTATPMHHGDICTLGLFCVATPGANRDLLDFIDAQIDPQGRAHIAFTGDLGAWQGIYAANQVSGPTVGPPGH